MTQTLMAWTNLAKLATVSATSTESGLPAENTLNDIGAPSTAWQSEAGTTTATLTYTLNDPGSAVRVIGIFRINATDQAQITATITLDSVETWTYTLSGPVTGYGQVVFVLTEDEPADSVAITIEDAGNPDGYLNVPLVMIAPAWLPTWPVSPASADNWAPEVNRQITRGGQVYQTSLSNPRTYSFEFGAVDPDETYAAAREIGRLASMGVNVLFIPNAEGAYVKQDAIFGIVSTVRPYGFLPGPGGVRTWGATITERL